MHTALGGWHLLGSVVRLAAVRCRLRELVVIVERRGALASVGGGRLVRSEDAFGLL